MEKPIVLVIMDGVGKGDGGSGDAVAVAKTPTLDHLLATCPHTYLKAHGTAVGLPTDDDMGNSEVGHNALGCGQIYSQGAKLVGESIENGTLYASETWKDLIANAVSGKALHFLGLLSDGNVHSNIHHLIAMLREAHAEGVKKAYCHILLDGRDVPATSALEYVDMLEKVLAELNTEGCDYAIASGGGRMQITMDRYEANWPMVEQGWRTHVQAIGRRFPSAKAAIETYRAETGCIDQDLPAFVIERSGEPVAKIANGDSVILFNFRAYAETFQHLTQHCMAFINMRCNLSPFIQKRHRTITIHRDIAILTKQLHSMTYTRFRYPKHRCNIYRTNSATLF